MCGQLPEVPRYHPLVQFTDGSLALQIDTGDTTALSTITGLQQDGIFHVGCYRLHTRGLFDILSNRLPALYGALSGHHPGMGHK